MPTNADRTNRLRIELLSIQTEISTDRKNLKKVPARRGTTESMRHAILSNRILKNREKIVEIRLILRQQKVQKESG